MSDFTLNRRQFIKLGSIAGGGFALGLPLSLLGEETPSLVGSAELNAYVRIADDGTITEPYLEQLRALGAM